MICALFYFVFFSDALPIPHTSLSECLLNFRFLTLLPTLPIRALVNNYVCVGAITLNASIGTVAVATAQPPQAPQTIVSRVIHQAEFKQVLSQVY